ncbi:MAG: 30S ribosomal protein S2 [Patescibacteria group bacterium]
MKEISLDEMLKSGAHFGHKVGRLYPKMKPFVFSSRNGISIINLVKTKEGLEKAAAFVQKIAEQKGLILFVGTKNQARDIIKKYAEKTKMPYISQRWIGGIFTNFSVILKMINRFKKLKAEAASGELEKYKKKERMKILEDIEKMEKNIGGIENLTRVPDALYVVDVIVEKTAIREAKKKKIPIIALVDVNGDPEGIDYVIPANDDATKSIELITRTIAEALALKEEDKKEETADKPKEEK